MATKRSVALLVHRVVDGNRLQVLIGHMGGPLWRHRPRGWTVPKGEYVGDEEPLAAACREFEEETGFVAPPGEYVALGEVRQSGGKVVSAWTVRAELDVTAAKSNTFVMEWPRGSGQLQEFPELDELRWVDVAAAVPMLVQAQTVFLDRLIAVTSGADDASAAPGEVLTLNPAVNSRMLCQLSYPWIRSTSVPVSERRGAAHILCKPAGGHGQVGSVRLEVVAEWA